MVTLIKTCLTVEKRDTIKFTIQNGKTSKQPQRKMLQGELNNSNKAASLTIKPGLRAKRKSSTTWTIDTKLWECYLPPFIQDKIYGKLEMAWKWGRIATHEAIMNFCLSLKASMLDYLPFETSKILLSKLSRWSPKRRFFTYPSPLRIPLVSPMPRKD